MAYLSRIWLNPLRRGAQRFIRSPQALHAAVLGGLSRQPVDERVLWRLETTEQRRAELLVLTQSLPAWDHLIEQAGWTTSEEPQFTVRPYDAVLAQVARGREFSFRLRANPVSATRQPSKPSPSQLRHLTSSTRTRGVRVPHRTVAHQLAWLTERAPGWGFRFPETEDGKPDVCIVERSRLVFSKSAENGDAVVLHRATFQGRVMIDSPDLARESLLRGVGPARAYGCGLITLAPPTVLHPEP